MYKPAKGDLAYCRQGKLGLILDVKVYHDGDGIIREIWKGVCCNPPYGPWQSKNPEFYGTLEQAVAVLDIYKIENNTQRKL